MHGRVCERRHKSRRRHMLISSSRVIASVEGGGSSCLSLSSSTSFCKVIQIDFVSIFSQAVIFSCFPLFGGWVCPEFCNFYWILGFS